MTLNWLTVCVLFDHISFAKSSFFIKIFTTIILCVQIFTAIESMQNQVAILLCVWGHFGVSEELAI